jgi:hypothetical protein
VRVWEPALASLRFGGLRETWNRSVTHGNITAMANYLDFLAAVDAFTRDSSRGCVYQACEMHVIAQEAGLATREQTVAAHWTGELVHGGYLTHGPGSLGDRRPVPYGPLWSDADLQRFSDFRVTAAGREEADRMRRLAREGRTDAALGARLPMLAQPWMSSGQVAALAQPLQALRDALDRGRSGATLGAAKDLVEAACKIAIERGGGTAARSASLPALFKQANSTLPETDGSDGALGRSMAATVQRLAELRNAVGAGHGHASVAELPAPLGRLAASAGAGVALPFACLSRRLRIAVVSTIRTGPHVSFWAVSSHAIRRSWRSTSWCGSSRARRGSITRREFSSTTGWPSCSAVAWRIESRASCSPVRPRCARTISPFERCDAARRWERASRGAQGRAPGI